MFSSQLPTGLRSTTLLQQTRRVITRRLPPLLSFAVVLGIAVLLVAPGATLAWDANSFNSASESQLYSLTNQARVSAGLPSLRIDSSLASIARYRSKDMEDRGYFSHNIPPSGKMVWDVMDERGYCYNLAGENIGWNNYPDDEATAQIQQMFMASAEHHDNILGRAWDVMGIGAYKGSDGHMMWTVLFAHLTPAESFIFAIGMVVAFVPEGLLPVVTLSLAMATQRMARRNALVKRLSAVETLGCTTVICTDKTGTLTQNEMTVRRIWTSDAQFTVSGAGYASDGRIEPEKSPGSGAAKQDVDGDAGRALHEVLRAAALCNDARLVPPDAGASDGQWTALGDPTEAALLVAARKGGIDYVAAGRAQPRLRELPFDSRRKRMSTLNAAGRPPGAAAPQPGTMQSLNGEPAIVAYVKGAPVEILARCSRILSAGSECGIDQAARDAVLAANDAYARAGLRVLAVARRELANAPAEPAPELIETDLTLLGLVAMHDPPRPEVAAAVDTCRRAGIRVVMITGDYGLTAESIARRIGIIGSESVRLVTGTELDAMADAALQEILAGEVVFARVSPEHKLRIVATLQGLGHIVAVTGDGVNDAPALRKADIGVAMGLAGTDVAKEAADMILTDDNFASIVNAVEEGRGVYEAIKKFAGYIFTSNTPEAWPFILFAFSGGRIPIALPIMQILAIDLGTDMAPALALGAEPPEPETMDRPPRSQRDHVITRGLLVRSLLYLGTIQSFAAMAAFYLYFWLNGHAGQWFDLPSSGPIYQAATAMTLAAVVMTQVGNLFAHRTERISVFALGPRRFFGNRLIWLGIATELLLIVVLVYLPIGNAVFGTAPFAPAWWLFLMAWVPALLVADELRKAVLRRRRPAAASATRGGRVRPAAAGGGGR